MKLLRGGSMLMSTISCSGTQNGAQCVTRPITLKLEKPQDILDGTPGADTGPLVGGTYWLAMARDESTPSQPLLERVVRSSEDHAGFNEPAHLRRLGAELAENNA